MRWVLIRLWLGIASSLILLLPRVSLSDGIIRDSAGGITSGRAGTNVAYADNGAIIGTNPAALANVSGRGLIDVRLDTYFNWFEYSDSKNHAPSEQLPAILPELSYIRRVRGSRWTVGVGILTPGGFSTQYHINNPVFGRSLNRSFAALAKVVPAAAYRLTDRLSVGATAGISLSLVKLKAPYYVQTGALAGTPTMIDLSTFGVAPAWSVGLQYDLSPATRFGAAYVAESSFSLHGRNHLTVGETDARYDASVDMTWPRSAAIGVLQKLDGGLRVSADATWMNWGDAFHNLNLRLSDGNSPSLPRTLADTLTVGWHDSYGCRLGFEYQRGPNTLRAGYAFHSSPMPDSRLTPLIPATLEHVLAVGYGWTDGIWGVAAAYQYSFGPDRSVSTSAFAGGEFDGSTLHADSHVLFLSITRYLQAPRRHTVGANKY